MLPPAYAGLRLDRLDMSADYLTLFVDFGRFKTSPFLVNQKLGTRNSKLIKGDVAQLGERCNGIAEVRGSIPLVSIFYFQALTRVGAFSFLASGTILARFCFSKAVTASRRMSFPRL